MMILLWTMLLCLDPGSDTIALMLKARFALLSGDYQKAHEMAEKAVALDGTDVEAAYLHIEILNERQKNRLVPAENIQEELITTLLKNVQKFKEDHRFPLLLGNMAAFQPTIVSNYPLAAPDVYLKQAIAIMEREPKRYHEDLADTWYNLGRWHLMGLRFFDASIAFKKVCEIDDDAIWAWYYAGQTCEASHQLQDAVHHYRTFRKVGAKEPWGNGPPLGVTVKVLELLLKPDAEKFEVFKKDLKENGDLNTMLSAAQKFDRMKQYDHALEVLALIPTASRGYEYHLLNSRIHMTLGRYDQYLKYAQKLLKREHRGRVRNLVFNVAVEAGTLLGDYKRLIQFVEDQTVLFQLNPDIKLSIAMVHYLLNEDSTPWEKILLEQKNLDMVGFWHEQVQLLGMHMAAKRMILQSYLREGLWAEAYAFLGGDKGAAQLKPQMAEELAVILAMMGQHDQAFQLYEKMLETKMERVDLLNNYGYFLTEAGVALEKAKTLIQKAITLEPDNAAYLDSMGWNAYKLGDFATAETYIRKALSFDANDPEQNEHLGDVLAAQGRPLEAKRYWSRAMEYTRDRYAEILKKMEKSP